MSNSIQAIIWDLDGVIIDSANEHRAAWQRLAREEGIPFSDETFLATFGKRNDDIFPMVWGELPPDKVRELSNRKEAYFREIYRDTATPLPGAIELMKEFQGLGYPQALATSTPVQNIQLISETLKLKRYLSVLISGEMVEHGKPAPDIFLRAAKELKQDPSHCLVIEDAVAGVQAAHAAGMRCIAVAGNRDLPGLREAEIIVKTLAEVDLERIRTLA